MKNACQLEKDLRNLTAYVNCLWITLVMVLNGHLCSTIGRVRCKYVDVFFFFFSLIDCHERKFFFRIFNFCLFCKLFASRLHLVHADLGSVNLQLDNAQYSISDEVF